MGEASGEADLVASLVDLVESVVDFAPGEDSVDLVVPAGLEVLSDDDAGDLVPAGESVAGEEVVPPGVVSLLPPSQAAKPVIAPTSSRAIIFDFTLQILTTFNFRL